MARRALRGGDRKTRSNVIRNVSTDVYRAVERRRVTTVTVRRLQRVVVVNVAGQAGCRRGRHVRAHQRETRGAVIERGTVPPRSGVTICAVGDGKPGPRGGVHGVIGLLPGCEMAAGVPAIGRCDLKSVVVADVAGSTSDSRVFVGERKTGCAVIKLSI